MLYHILKVVFVHLWLHKMCFTEEQGGTNRDHKILRFQISPKHSKIKRIPSLAKFKWLQSVCKCTTALKSEASQVHFKFTANAITTSVFLQYASAARVLRKVCFQICVVCLLIRIRPHMHNITLLYPCVNVVFFHSLASAIFVQIIFHQYFERSLRKHNGLEAHIICIYSCMHWRFQYATQKDFGVIAAIMHTDVRVLCCARVSRCMVFVKYDVFVVVWLRIDEHKKTTVTCLSFVWRMFSSEVAY